MYLHKDFLLIKSIKNNTSKVKKRFKNGSRVN